MNIISLIAIGARLQEGGRPVTLVILCVPMSLKYTKNEEAHDSVHVPEPRAKLRVSLLVREQ